MQLRKDHSESTVRWYYDTSIESWVIRINIPLSDLPAKHEKELEPLIVKIQEQMSLFCREKRGH
jgi:hypothetical protein